MNEVERFLKKFNFKETNIQEYESGSLKISKSGDYWIVSDNGHAWLQYNSLTKNAVMEVFSHYCFAEGHCICTGLGLGLRESWLLTKPNVTKLTVIEKNKELIEYHKKHNPELMNKIEIINCDVNEYFGSCDTLLLDHYEQEDMFSIADNASKICKQIKSKTTWIWPLEQMIFHGKGYLYADSYMEVFEHIKKEYPINFPEMDERKLSLFVEIYYLRVIQQQFDLAKSFVV